jgi:zinc/manganese transport system substrate-binding protein/manganese/iron transport system substrate-binding protein
MTALLVLGCSDDEDAGFSVVATTTQIGDFARNVGGDDLNLTVLLDPNQDAHDFEPEPSQIRALANADLVLRNGIGLDTFVNKAVEGVDAEVAVVTDRIQLRAGGGHEEEEGEEEEDEEAHEEAGGNDPHVWLSVANAKIMVENVRVALREADAANASLYDQNAQRYLAELDGLDASIRQQVATIPSACRKLVTNHEVLGYYAEAYGLEVVGSIIPGATTEAQPSASDVAGIVQRIRAAGVPAIFAETSVNPALIRQVGREAGVTVVDDLYGDSLGPAGSDGATYIQMMQSNTKKIVEALRTCGR